MSQQTDEAEHSIEMQLPYIAKAMERYGYVSSQTDVNYTCFGLHNTIVKIYVLLFLNK